MKIDKVDVKNWNNKWDIDRWEEEKEKASETLKKTKKFIEDTEKLKKKKVNVGTMEDFTEMMHNKEKIDYLEDQKKHKEYLEKKLNKIDKKIENLRKNE